MDNNAFETKMINTVNANAKTASDKREAKDTKRKKTNKRRAIAEIFCWVLCFVALAYSMHILCWLNYIPTGLAIVIPSCIGWIGGVRVGGLINLI